MAGFFVGSKNPSGEPEYTVKEREFDENNLTPLVNLSPHLSLTVYTQVGNCLLVAIKPHPLTPPSQG
ncbi:hypothetical protein NIES806_22130 [Dolichospermum compactum NIES-806]|uniref:Uncharacterized protein n=1 Tax=Dolichospermum compactum NIES-806 TaxID=1973481 RepID=A0A1Z4V3G0_9CYAN|nr:hypothetical protein NIES806_22130 [Dolichospermum compactum NIES-806]